MPTPAPIRTVLVLALLLTGTSPASAADLLGDGPRLGPLAERLTQDEVEGGTMSLDDLRRTGLAIFATPLNKYDGFGDGPMDPVDPTSPGGRPTLQNNGTFLRVNGLDAQACVECHALTSTATVPPRFGVGGFGGISASPLPGARRVDLVDAEGNGFAWLDGRLIVPPHLFGSGGVELAAKEMTAELQSLAALARANPGERIALRTKGVRFGHVWSDVDGVLDTSEVEGIGTDLVVRPFGRKGDFPTVRAFDQEAMAFHFGIQPNEVVGADVDDDGDGVSNELLVGEMSALEIFLTTMDRPLRLRARGEAKRGQRKFRRAGCASCHKPVLRTDSTVLTYSFPEVATDPGANVYASVELSEGLHAFGTHPRGGLKVGAFSDLKRHDMGEGLAETVGRVSSQRNREFVTAKLWGVADSAPYLHDGRAQTLGEAIRLHGGEAEAAREAFLAMTTDDQSALIAFLGTLRLPDDPNSDVVPR